MKKQLIQLIKKNKKLFLIARSLRFLQSSTFSKINGSQKKYPKVIQLPITYNCNSRCVMCNIWQMDHSGEATVEEFANFMQDDIFKKVQSVGINGGEPTLIGNIDEYAKVILTLPVIKSLNIISHGFNTSRALKAFEKIYSACREKGVGYNLSGLRGLVNFCFFEDTGSGPDCA